MSACLLAPPWATKAEWKEANQTLAYLIRIHRPNLDRAAFHAETIRSGLQTIFPVLDELCAGTCRFCPEPCCVSAVVWVDFYDLLFMRLTGTDVPPTQLISHPDQTCRYLGPKGCSLPRMARPWACTWYLCPPQTARLRKKHPKDRKIFENAIRIVKAGRKQAESEFVKATTIGL